MKTYSVPRPGQGFIWEDGKRRVLPHRLDLRNHSPTGFDYRPRILCDALGDDQRALSLYRRFKDVAIPGQPEDQPFEMTDEQVLAFVKRIESEEPVDGVA